jgi:RimJ/RimL family protein N-acetyltransferase
MNTASAVEPGLIRAPEKADPPRLTTRQLALRPVLPGDLDFLYALATEPDTGYRWRWRGGIPPYESFAHSSGADVYAEFIVVLRSTGRPIGHLIVLDADLHSGHVSIGIVLTGPAQRSGLGLQAVLVAIDYLFRTGPFHKIYADSVEFAFASFSSGAGRLFHEEGRLRRHHFYDGRHWDKLIIAVYREDWVRFGRRLLEPLLESTPQPAHRREASLS